MIRMVLTLQCRILYTNQEIYLLWKDSQKHTWHLKMQKAENLYSAKCNNVEKYAYKCSVLRLIWVTGIISPCLKSGLRQPQVLQSSEKEVGDLAVLSEPYHPLSTHTQPTKKKGMLKHLPVWLRSPAGFATINSTIYGSIFGYSAGCFIVFPPNHTI